MSSCRLPGARSCRAGDGRGAVDLPESPQRHLDRGSGEMMDRVSPWFSVSALQAVCCVSVCRGFSLLLKTESLRAVQGAGGHRGKESPATRQVFVRNTQRGESSDRRCFDQLDPLKPASAEERHKPKETKQGGLLPRTGGWAKDGSAKKFPTVDQRSVPPPRAQGRAKINAG